MRRTCSTCAYRKEIREGKLACFRYPPAMFPMARTNPLTQQPENGFMQANPEVDPGHCCGEWKSGRLDIV